LLVASGVGSERKGNVVAVTGNDNVQWTDTGWSLS
jgi:hypothetical protein